MNVLASLLIGMIVLYVVFVQIREYNELIRAKFRFKFFSLRDRLALLVISGKLREDSWEYKHIIDTLNFHISAVEHVSVMRIVDMLVKYHTSPKEERDVQRLSKHIEQKDVALILVDYMATTYDLIKKNSRVQIFLLNLASLFINKSKNKSKPEFVARPKHRVVVNPGSALSAIKSRQSVFEATLAAA